MLDYLLLPSLRAVGRVPRRAILICTYECHSRYLFIHNTNLLCRNGGFFVACRDGRSDFELTNTVFAILSQNKSAVFTADFYFYRHFERSEKSIDRSFAALRMTAAVFGFYRHFERSEKSCRNPLDNFFLLNYYSQRSIYRAYFLFKKR